jgi:hypothetical protein
MKIKLLTAVLLILGCITCSKDTYNTKPTLTFESVNNTIFPQPSVVVFKLQCTDKEGDVVDTIWVQRVSKVACDPSLSRIDSFRIPNFDPPKNVKADFYFTYSYPPDQSGNANLLACTIGQSESATDTSYFRFWMHDRANHISDTVNSPEIVLLKQE